MLHKFRDVSLGAGFGFLLLAALVPTLSPLLADVEGYFFPVVKDVKVTSVRDVPGGVSIKVTFNKVRDCPDFIGVSWYSIGSDGALRRAILRFPNAEDDSDQGRTTGVHVDDGWFLGMTREQLQNSQAIARHRCHVLWPTTTHFYPPR